VCLRGDNFVVWMSTPPADYRCTAILTHITFTLIYIAALKIYQMKQDAKIFINLIKFYVARSLSSNFNLRGLFYLKKMRCKQLHADIDKILSAISINHAIVLDFFLQIKMQVSIEKIRMHFKRSRNKNLLMYSFFVTQSTIILTVSYCKDKM